MWKILIIGEHSYIGTSFREYMAKYAPEEEVVCVSARDDKWKAIDLSAFDVILHVAAIVHKKEQLNMNALYQEVNTQLPIEVAEKAKNSGVKQFVFFSTMAVYGNEIPVVDKDTRLHPVTMYGKSKLDAEQQLNRLADQSFTVIVLRPPMVYGANCPGNYMRLSKLARKVAFFPKISNQRSMIYIENLCACIHREIIKNGENYRIVCPQNIEYVNTTELVKQIRRVYNKKTLVIPFPQFVVKGVSKKSATVQKVFGDCCYKHEGQERDYQVVDFEESIVRTEMR